MYEGAYSDFGSLIVLRIVGTALKVSAIIATTIATSGLSVAIQRAIPPKDASRQTTFSVSSFSHFGFFIIETIKTSSGVSPRANVTADRHPTPALTSAANVIIGVIPHRSQLSGYGWAFPVMTALKYEKPPSNLIATATARNPMGIIFYFGFYNPSAYILTDCLG